MHYYEKLLISIVIFLGVVIGTAGIIGNYVKEVNKTKPNDGDRIIIDSI